MDGKTGRGAACRMALALGGALVLASAQPAAAGKVRFAACNYPITVPGTYVLVSDLTCNGLRFVTISASNVHLDLGSHVISGTGSSLGVAVFPPTPANVTGVRITGGLLTGFSTGIFLVGCTRCRVANSRTNGNSAQGIALLLGTSASRIADNVANGNGTVGILAGEGSTGNRLKDNTATANGVFDLDDTSLPSCVNTWRDNTFATDNETGAAFGPGAGCIR
jgi:parallel beta-helix repeat protein